MIIVLKNSAQKAQIDDLLNKIAIAGLKPLYMPGKEKIVLGAIGDERVLEKLNIENYSYVEKVVPILSPYKLASRELNPSETVIDVNGNYIGAPYFTIIAGPCAVESNDQMLSTAGFLQKQNVAFLRGGAFKPRSSPYSFQGLGKKAFEILKDAKEKFGMQIVTEVIDTQDVDLISEYADILQIGARNMQNFNLLKKVGKGNKPVLLKRGMSATINEFLMSAEYVLSEGNPNVILCERGVRTFETAYRNTLDLTAIPVLKEKTHLPVIVDPSHAAGNRNYVISLAKAALVAGADGLLVEIHPSPDQAMSDGKQSLDFDQFALMHSQLNKLAKIENRILR